jgi:hypothetical protein
VCSGNHDLIGRDEHGEQSALWLTGVRASDVHVDGDAVALGDVLITVCPWWDGPIGREAVAQQLAADAARRRTTWVWVYHWPPDRSPTCWTGRRYYDDADLLGWIEEHRPEVVLAGHVHESPFQAEGSWVDRIGTTWVFNAGRSIGPIPPHVVLDLGAGMAEWWSYEATAEQRLDQPLAPVIG